MPVNIHYIQELHLELSSICNARCPLCPRNFYGYPRNSGYVETNLTLDLVKKAFKKDFILQLEHLLINGNFGDMISNLESVDIIRYFKDNNPLLKVTVSTNGSARNLKFWEDLGKLGITVEFCLDGLEDTHKLYRLDTDWHKIVKNAQTFIANGGKAIWKMIKFPHNQHQIDQCRQLALSNGFSDFHLVDEGRNKGPVFNKDGSLNYIMGDYVGPQDLESLKKYWDNIEYKNLPFLHFDNSNTIDCYSKNYNSIYVNAEGKVYPCCYLGFYPQSYKGTFFKYINAQIKEIEKNNNLNDNDLDKALEWFKSVENSWTKENTESGRMIQCDYICGKCDKSKPTRKVNNVTSSK